MCLFCASFVSRAGRQIYYKTSINQVFWGLWEKVEEMEAFLGF